MAGDLSGFSTPPSSISSELKIAGPISDVKINNYSFLKMFEYFVSRHEFEIRNIQNRKRQTKITWPLKTQFLTLLTISFYFPQFFLQKLLCAGLSMT